MAVNGIEIRIGQRWRLRDGDVGIVAHYMSNHRCCWQIRPAGFVAGVVHVDDNGCQNPGEEAQGDLIELLVKNPVPADAPPAPGGKLTNPKDQSGDGKVPLWLLSPAAKAQWSVAQFVGLSKYGAWNWRLAGVRSSTYLSAMQRHIDAYTSGEELDPVDGTPHLGHVMACAAILIDAGAAGKLTDDRPPSVSLRPAYAEAEGQMEQVKELYSGRNPRHYTINDTEPK